MANVDLLERVESWLVILDQSNYYELLGILEIADESAIQRAFHEFSTNFHPDRYRGESQELVDAITNIYQRGAEAYGVLRNPSTRARYDLALSQGALRYNPGLTNHHLDRSTQNNLVGLARTKAGQLHCRQAERALSEGQLDEARALVKKALLAEGKNAELEARANELVELIASGQIIAHDEGNL